MSAAGQSSGEPGGVWVVIPYKGAAGSKRRLATLLDDDERAQLGRALFEGVLDAVLGTPAVSRTLVIQPASVPIPDRTGPQLTYVSEWPTLPTLASGLPDDGLNQALRQAQQAALDGGADSLIRLPSDLPMIGAADIEALTQAARDADVVITPDRASEGTNALPLRPPTALAPAFGPSSFARHQEFTQSAGLRTTVLRRWGLALDLDTPADVLRLYALAPECRAARLLREMGVTSKLIEGLGLADTAPSRT